MRDDVLFATLKGLPPSYLLAGLGLVWFIHAFFSQKNLRHIPTVGGPSLPIISFVGLYNFLSGGSDVLREAYTTHKGRAFKIPMIDRWLVVLSGKNLVDDIQKLPDGTVEAAVMDIFNIYPLMGAKWHNDPLYLPPVRNLTRNMGSVFHDMFDEVAITCSELIPAKGGGWLPIHVYPAMHTLVARAANRVFVGLPVCRQQGYIDIMVHFAEDIISGVLKLSVVPSFMRGFVARKTTVVDERIRLCLAYLQPTIDDRKAMMARFGKDWTDKPNDMMQWLIDETVARGQDDAEIARLVLFINTGAIDTTSHAIVEAVYDIAVRPELASTLREEVEAAVAEDGWTRAATAKMRRLDSFLRESLRLHGPGTTAMFRNVLKPITLSDGTYLPAGTTITAPTLAAHLDDTNYADAAHFDALRFYKPEDKVQPQLTTTSTDFMTFGHGRFACPGRFFAQNELKAMMAYMLVHYDMLPEHEGERPANVYTGLSVLPDAKAKVLFRKRRVD